MDEPISLSDLKPTPGAVALHESQDRIDSVFQQLAIRNTASIDNGVAGLLARKIEEVKAASPELTDREAYIVAARLLKQLVSCYQSAVNRLLP